MANDKIVIKGAREHNLKNVNLTLPREKLIVMTGLSGSGKSSLAFDTIYADGQRRYVESLSSYARMFLGRMDKPDVDEITGLSPAISIDQKTTSHNPRSTVGTVTEIYDYLRLLYARVGVPHCPVCGRVIRQQSVDEMVDAVLKLDEGTKFQVLAPVGSLKVVECYSLSGKENTDVTCYRCHQITFFDFITVFAVKIDLCFFVKDCKYSCVNVKTCYNTIFFCDKVYGSLSCSRHNCVCGNVLACDIFL